MLTFLDRIENPVLSVCTCTRFSEVAERTARTSNGATAATHRGKPVPLLPRSSACHFFLSSEEEALALLFLALLLLLLLLLFLTILFLFLPGGTGARSMNVGRARGRTRGRGGR